MAGGWMGVTELPTIFWDKLQGLVSAIVAFIQSIYGS